MSNMTNEEIEKLKTIMLDFGEAHNLLAKSTLSKEEYQPISWLLSKAKVELFNFYKKHKAALQNKVSDEEIENEVKRLSKISTAADKETPDWMESDLRNGIKAGILLQQNKVTADPSTEQSTKYLSAEEVLSKYVWNGFSHSRSEEDCLKAMLEYASIKNKVSDVSAEEILDKYYLPKMHWKTVNRKQVLNAMKEYAISETYDAMEEYPNKKKFNHG